MEGEQRGSEEGAQGARGVLKAQGGKSRWRALARGGDGTPGRGRGAGRGRAGRTGARGRRGRVREALPGGPVETGPVKSSGLGSEQCLGPVGVGSGPNEQ